MKFNEEKYLKEAQEYIENTYRQHYVGRKEIQVVDIWDNLGTLDTTSRDVAIKYLVRYGKKGGKNRTDLLKAIHYIFLMLYVQDTTPNGLEKKDT